jgi:hypothetical protein
MNLYKKLKRALLLGLGLLTIYTTNVSARDDYHLASMQQQDSGADIYSSFFDKPQEMKSISFAFDVGSFRGGLNVKTNSDMKLNSTSLKMDFGNLFSPNIQGFNMYSDDRNFKIQNVSKIGSRRRLKRRFRLIRILMLRI